LPRHDGRSESDLRAVTFRPGFTRNAASSVLVEFGNTMVLCTASIDTSLPPWRKPRSEEDPVLGWVTAEYSMLPGSTSPRKNRDRLKVDGRTTEIQRLIGRSLRAAVDFEALGGNVVTIDCDVLQADGGTRTASITGGYVALALAVRELESTRPILVDSVAAISVGVVDGQAVLDLDYQEDSTAEVDMNVVMTGSGKFIEVQGTAETDPFDQSTLQQMLSLAHSGIQTLTMRQQQALSA
jgi:ribonuclease PH